MSNLQSTLSGQPYPGLPLPGPDFIRLIILQRGSEENIHCKLIIRRLDSTEPYEALSYTWGDSEDPKSIYLETHEFLVTSNCFSALRRLRYTDKPRVLWIDALTINQLDLSERNHQVSLMSRIYSQAATVVIYLGEATKDSDQSVTFIMECDNPEKYSNALSHPKTEALVKSLISLFNRSWFTRVWVIQEALLATSGLIYCGDKTLPWSAIKNFNDYNVNEKWIPQLPFVVSTCKGFLTDTKTQVQSAMLKALLDSRHCKATDPRDKVYSLLPLLHSFDERLDIRPQYDLSVAKVYTDCAIALMEKQGFEILYAVQGSSSIEGLPSWAPDWSVPTKRQMIGLNPILDWASLYGKEDLPETECPTTIVREGSDTTTVALQVYGHLCGRISKIGVAFTAGHSLLPLDEWQDLLSDAAVVAIDRMRSRCSFYCNDFLGCAFYDTIGGVHAYLNDTNEYFSLSLGRWNEIVCERELESTTQNPSTSHSLPFKDIPFHEAGKSLVNSYKITVQRILQTCHSRRFFVTDTGYMGLAPEEARAGDCVYKCVGSRVPFDLREIQTRSDCSDMSRYYLIGECKMEEKVDKDFDDRVDEPQCLTII